MTAAELEQRLDALFAPGCDPYRAAAAVLFDKPADAITHDDRDLFKRVFIRMLKRYRGDDQTLRDASEAFRRIVSALNAEKLLARDGYKLPTLLVESLTAKKLSPDEMSKVAADGFELCVRALVQMGAPDVTFHECGEREFEERRG